MDFSYKKFALMCLDRDTSPSAVAQKIGLSNAAATGWKNGKRPRDKTIEQLAIALDCSVEHLLENKQKENPAAPKNDGLSGLSGTERALIELFRSDETARARLEFELEMANKKAAQKDG